jgi:hypothetical protein
MEILEKTLFIIAFLYLLTQTVRHLYVRWIEPTNSVLDKYETMVKGEIKKASSLDELVKQYEEGRRKIQEAELINMDLMMVSELRSEVKLLEEAIRGWESRTREIFQLRFYWGCGFVLSLLGIFCYRQNYLWLGLSMMIAGIGDMIWWTSPSFRWTGSAKEFDRLLTNKIIFSGLSILITLVTASLVDLLNTVRQKL